MVINKLKLQEIVDRIAFCLYILFAIMFWILLVAGMVVHNSGLIILGGVFFVIAISLLYLGMRYLDFQLLSRAFPYCITDTLDSSKNYRQIETVLKLAQQPETSWMRRHELRQELSDLILRKPAYFRLYRSEIKDVHPQFTMSNGALPGRTI